MKKDLSGFTLIEMVVIILIIAILSVEVITQSTSTVTPLTVSGAASQVANDIRYTQALSMFSGQRYYLVSTASNQYAIQNGSGTGIPLANGTLVATLPAGVVFGGTTNLSNLIGFTGRGIPITDTSGTLLTAAATVLITSGAYSNTITISPTTGRIVIS
jgi:type II secretory pathway pseudopilin PulG